MEVVYHPLVKQDIGEALKYYAEILPRLADEFESEICLIASQVAENPLRFHSTAQGFRRANFRRFPYHLLYEVHENFIRIMHIRHNKRHPNYHAGRK